MTHYISSVTCPHCGKSGPTSSKNPKNMVGSPLKTCGYCRYVYFDKRYTENAISFYEGFDYNFSSFMWLVLGIVFLFLGIFNLVNKATDSDALLVLSFLGFGLFFFNVGIRALQGCSKKRIEYILKYKSETVDGLSDSLIRLKNDNYVEILESHGQYVPEFIKQLVKSPVPENSYTERQKNLYENPQKIRGTIIIAFIIFAVLSSIAIGHYTDNKHSNLQSEMQALISSIPNPECGDKIISYNQISEEYTKEYLTTEQTTLNSSEVGYILYYSKTKTECTAYYGYKQLKGTVEVVTLSLLDLHTGEILGKTTFTAEPPKTVKSSATSFSGYIHSSDVQEWVNNLIS